MPSEDFISYSDALLFLNMSTASPQEEEQINYLIKLATATIINYCGQDPRADPDQDCVVLGLVAAKLITSWFVRIANETSGIVSQSFAEVAMTFTADSDLDAMSKKILERYQSYSIA